MLLSNRRWRGLEMRRTIAVGLIAVCLFVSVGVGSAAADPINGLNGGTGTLVCGDVTYTIVSPFGPTPAGQMLTANGSNSTRVQIMILDKAARFPQSMLTDCMFTSPEQFELQLLIAPTG
jgi:hypothetical protein